MFILYLIFYYIIPKRPVDNYLTRYRGTCYDCFSYWLILTNNWNKHKHMKYIDFAEKFKALLRGDAASRANFYNTMVNMGAMTRNQVRRLENWNVLPGLDEPLTPLNMRQGQDESPSSPEQKPPPEPTPPAAPPGRGRRADSVTPHYRALVLDAAARMVRRETQALARLAAKHAADSPAFHAAAWTF